MNCGLLSDYWIAEFLIYGAAGACLNLGRRLKKRTKYVMLRT